MIMISCLHLPGLNKTGHILTFRLKNTSKMDGIKKRVSLEVLTAEITCDDDMVLNNDLHIERKDDIRIVVKPGLFLQV